MRDAVTAMVEGMDRILEVGPGPVPFPSATEFIDWQAWPELAGKPVHALDVNGDPFPFEDKSFDFVYCRHTLEDIYNPVWLCKEMSRVGRAGYVETPSPVAEYVRGVDPEDKPWRGYCHHRHLFWVNQETLMILPKLPIIEWAALPSESHQISILNEGPIFWNTYFFWGGDLNFKLLRHDMEFQILPEYPNLLQEALAWSEQNNRQLIKRFNF